MGKQNKIVRQDQSLSRFENETILESLKGFRDKMNEEPVKVENHPLYKKDGKPIQYVPISQIQAQLDKDFNCMWSEEDFKISVAPGMNGVNIVNSSIVLKYPAPVLDGDGKIIWLTRAGTASIKVSDKQAHLFAANLKSRALSNAAGSLGKRYGRDLARKASQVEVETYYEFVEIYWDALLEIDDEPGLMAYHAQQPRSIQNNKNWIQLYNARRDMIIAEQHQKKGNNSEPVEDVEEIQSLDNNQ